MLSGPYGLESIPNGEEQERLREVIANVTNLMYWATTHPALPFAVRQRVIAAWLVGRAYGILRGEVRFLLLRSAPPGNSTATTTARRGRSLPSACGVLLS